MGVARASRSSDQTMRGLDLFEARHANGQELFEGNKLTINF